MHTDRISIVVVSRVLSFALRVFSLVLRNILELRIVCWLLVLMKLSVIILNLKCILVCSFSIQL
jgi:hypothetical protein